MIDAEKLMAIGTAEMLKHRADNIMLAVPIPDVCILVSQLQLALRHPENPSAVFVRGYCETIIGQVEKISPELADFLRLGFDPQYDARAGGCQP